MDGYNGNHLNVSTHSTAALDNSHVPHSTVADGMRHVLHLHRKPKDATKIFRTVQDMSEAVASFRDQLIEVGQPQDSLKVRQKATKVLLVCFDLCKKTFADVQDVLTRNRLLINSNNSNSSTDGYASTRHAPVVNSVSSMTSSATDMNNSAKTASSSSTSPPTPPPPPVVSEAMNTVMISFVACMSLFINELEKCYQLFNAFPANERGIVWNTKPLASFTTDPFDSSFEVARRMHEGNGTTVTTTTTTNHIEVQSASAIAQHASHNSLLNDVDRTIKATESMLAEIEKHVQYVVVAPETTKHISLVSRIRLSLVPSHYSLSGNRRHSSSRDQHQQHPTTLFRNVSNTSTGSCVQMLQCRPKRSNLQPRISTE